MEGTLVINSSTSTGRGIQNMWIDSENGGQGERFEAANAEEAGRHYRNTWKSKTNNHITNKGKRYVRI